MDVQGNPATWGQYLFPFGINLGGIDVPNPFEFNLNAVATPFIFEGLPWALDRRLSPGGCIPGACEGTAQTLDPFPFSGLDPRTQAATPKTAYNDPNYTASPLNTPVFGASNRILSFVGPGGNFNGNTTVLPFSLTVPVFPVDPAAIPIAPIVPVTLVCTAGGLNTPPVAADDVATTPENTAVVIDVLANDSDPDVGGTLNATTVTVVNAAANGTAVADPVTGAITYTPNALFVGLDSFTYTVQDNLGAVSNVAIVRVTVTAAAGNTPPVAVDDTGATPQNTAVVIDVLANDSDADVGGTLNPATVTVANATAGVTTVVDTVSGAITYTPNTGFAGLDVFTYTVQDNLGAVSNTAIVRVTVNAAGVNTPPLAVNDIATTLLNTAVVINVLANDSDPDVGGSLNPASVAVVNAPANGTTLIDAVTGAITYTPNASFTGIDSFNYTVQDNLGAVSNVAIVRVTVTAIPNTPPVAVDDAATTLQNTAAVINVLANDSDPDVGGTLNPATVTVVSAAANGTTLVNTTSGAITYTPNIGFAGLDSFTYTVRDNLGAVSNVALVRVNVQFVNTPPVAVNDGPFRTPIGTAIQINVLANDTDVDGILIPSTVTIVPGTTAPAGSATIVVSTATGIVAFVPAAGFTGVVTFRYTVADNLGAVSNQATVTVTVNATGTAEVLTVTRAEFRLAAGPYDIRGTTTVPNAAITMHLGPTLGGPGIATVLADAAGNWRFTGFSTLPGAATTISVVSTGGASVLGFPLTIR